MVKDNAYILLADDDVEDQDILKDAISRSHPETIIRSLWNGKEVVNYLDRCTPDALPSLIILDYKMPLLSAADVLNEIGDDDRYRVIPKVVWSSSKNPEHIKQCLERGASRYFAKPVTPAELQQVVSEIFEIREQAGDHS